MADGFRLLFFCLHISNNYCIISVLGIVFSFQRLTIQETKNHEMKNIFFFLFLVAVLATACDRDCTQEDWVGTYTATIDCTNEDIVEEEFRISPGATENEIVIEGSALMINGCVVSGSETFMDEVLGITIVSTIDGELDGDNIRLVQATELFGITTVCDIIGEKQ